MDKKILYAGAREILVLILLLKDTISNLSSTCIVPLISLSFFLTVGTYFNACINYNFLVYFKK